MVKGRYRERNLERPCRKAVAQQRAKPSMPQPKPSALSTKSISLVGEACGKCDREVFYPTLRRTAV